MKRIIFILIFLFYGVLSTVSVGQGSGQATMRVSVEIVSGTSVKADIPEHIQLSQTSSSELGSLLIKGIDLSDVLIHSSKKIILQDESGKEIDVEVSSRQKKVGHSEMLISLLGATRSNAKPGTYRGDLSTTLEYL